MKFKLNNADCDVRKENVHVYEQWGFKFEPLNEGLYGKYYRKRIYDKSLTIDINTIEDLMKLIDSFGEVIVDDEGTITIYDGYIE